MRTAVIRRAPHEWLQVPFPIQNAQDPRLVLRALRDEDKRSRSLKRNAGGAGAEIIFGVFQHRRRWSGQLQGTQIHGRREHGPPMKIDQMTARKKARVTAEFYEHPRLATGK